jgi:hypothetical protein
VIQNYCFWQLNLSTILFFYHIHKLCDPLWCKRKKVYYFLRNQYFFVFLQKDSLCKFFSPTNLDPWFFLILIFSYFVSPFLFIPLTSKDQLSFAFLLHLQAFFSVFVTVFLPISFLYQMLYFFQNSWDWPLFLFFCPDLCNIHYLLKHQQY